MLESLFKNIADLKVCKFVKETPPTQVLSCEYRKILKTAFHRTLLVAACEESYSTPPQELCIFMNVYDFFKFCTLISQ